MITCSHCGQILPDDTKFCSACGASVTPETPPTLEQNAFTQNPYILPNQPQNSYAQQTDYAQQAYNPPYQQPYVQGQQNDSGMQQNYTYSQQYPVKADKSTGKSVASLILGILSILLWCTIVTDSFDDLCWAAIPLGIIGLVLGCIARKEIKNANHDKSTAMATAGIVCSIIGLSITALLVMLILLMAIGYAATDLF